MEAKLGISHMDEMVREYLLFRGFNKTLQSFDIERKQDRLRSFDAQLIVDTLLGYARDGQFESLQSLWKFLMSRFFSRAHPNMAMVVNKLERSLYRLYLVYSMHEQKPERVSEFFHHCSPDILRDSDWKLWFTLPYVKSPETDPHFSVYFSKYWLDSFSMSLSNFLISVFNNMPLPKLLSFNLAHLASQQAECEIEHLKTQLEHFRAAAVAAGNSQRSSSAGQIHSTSTAQPSGNQTPSSSSGVGRRTVSPEGSMRGVRPSASAGHAHSNPAIPTHATLPRRTSPMGSSNSDLAAPSTPTNFTAEEGNRSRRSRTGGTLSSIEDELLSDSSRQVDGEEDLRQSTSSPEKSRVVMKSVTCSGHRAAITAVRYSVSGDVVASADSDGSVLLWDVGRGYRGSAGALPPLMGSMSCYGRVQAMDWDRENGSDALYCGTADGRVCVLAARSLGKRGEWMADPTTPRVAALSASPIQTKVAAALQNGALTKGLITVWDPVTGKPLRSLNLSKGVATSVCWNATGTLLYVGGTSGVIDVLDFASGQCVQSLVASANGSVNGLQCIGNALFATVSDETDSRVQEWNMAHAERVGNVQISPSIVSTVDPTGDWAAYSPSDLTASAYVVRLASPSEPPIAVRGHTQPVLCLDWSPGGLTLASGSNDHLLNLYHFQDSM